MKTLHKRFIVLWVSLFVIGIIWGCDSIEKQNDTSDYTVESDNNLDINNSMFIHNVWSWFCSPIRSQNDDAKSDKEYSDDHPLKSLFFYFLAKYRSI